MHPTWGGQGQVDGHSKEACLSFHIPQCHSATNIKPPSLIPHNRPTLHHSHDPPGEGSGRPIGTVKRHVFASTSHSFISLLQLDASRWPLPDRLLTKLLWPPNTPTHVQLLASHTCTTDGRKVVAVGWGSEDGLGFDGCCPTPERPAGMDWCLWAGNQRMQWTATPNQSQDMFCEGQMKAEWNFRAPCKFCVASGSHHLHIQQLQHKIPATQPSHVPAAPHLQSPVCCCQHHQC